MVDTKSFILLFLITFILKIIFFALHLYSHLQNINTQYKTKNQIKNSEGIINSSILYTKSDSFLRKNPILISDIITVVVKGTKVKYLNKSKADLNGILFDKVKTIKIGLYSNEFIGFIDHNQLSVNVINESNNLISIESKNKMVNEALYLLNSNNLYSRSLKRRSGFFNYTIGDIYYFDCSSFCSAILNRVFTFYPKSNSNSVIVWSTFDYLKDIHSKNSRFEIIESINKAGKQLDLNKLQTGDFILGKAKLINKGINHIMLYIGERYIIHSTETLFYDRKKKLMRNGILMTKLNNSNYYTELETKENIKKGNITKRFDSEIYIIRFIEIKKLHK